MRNIAQSGLGDMNKKNRDFRKLSKTRTKYYLKSLLSLQSNTLRFHEKFDHFHVKATLSYKCSISIRFFWL